MVNGGNSGGDACFENAITSVYVATRLMRADAAALIKFSIVSCLRWCGIS
ncbi:MAG: hypothetical protein ACKESB_01170 [Candidatus Hodgkinia cicadicola]